MGLSGVDMPNLAASPNWMFRGRKGHQEGEGGWREVWIHLSHVGFMIVKYNF